MTSSPSFGYCAAQKMHYFGSKIHAVCRHKLSVNPSSGTVFVFINRNKTMVRALTYDGTGFWLMTKRLSKGKFRTWPSSNQRIKPLMAKQLRHLLCNNDPSGEKKIFFDR